MDKIVYIRSMTREDVSAMVKWTKHENPLFFHYNFPQMSERDCDRWFYERTKRMGRRNFIIENKEREIVGYMSIRNIKLFGRSSELGIVMNPAQMNKKYGRSAILKFMEYYFYNMNMKKLKLRVAEYNERALKCYESCGFKNLGQRYELFEDQDSEVFTNDKYKEYKKYFRYKRDRKLLKYIHMEITKEKYEEIKISQENMVLE
ncbi:MAG: GNAT family N-acetyltransferase [Anaeromicrobium sp.]|uniref:GNAT family N-acetyltransferase n=1 Tax=Anaeromicrobium sp. TaxID=1929132 RepID=UPI002600C92D|nr:GNAT family N-acetyltransferase [Anaeromicrobium sp.]MCT4595439.1 GNAT family N-acetyltransferase [Anaeromicrobium sp.]